MTTSLALVAIIGFSVRSIVRARRHLRLALELDGDASCGDLCPCTAFAGVNDWDVTLVGSTDDEMPCGCIPYEHDNYGPCGGAA